MKLNNLKKITFFKFNLPLNKEISFKLIGDEMDNFEEKRSVLVNKYTNAPETVSKKDLSSYESFYALKTYFWNTKQDNANFGKYEVSHIMRQGLLSNSRKTRTPTQHMFVITDTDTGEKWEEGFITTHLHNRRSRCGNIESYMKDIAPDKSHQVNELKSEPLKEFKKGSVAEMAKELHLPIDLLLKQFKEFQSEICNEDDLITPEDKDRLLNFLMGNYQKKEKARLR
jgi:hypothetical protein